MTDPGFEAYLVEVISRTGVHRYRYLSTEQPDLVERARWQAWVIGEASGTHDGPRYDPDAQHNSRPCCDGNPYGEDGTVTS